MGLVSPMKKGVVEMAMEGQVLMVQSVSGLEKERQFCKKRLENQAPKLPVNFNFLIIPLSW